VYVVVDKVELEPSTDAPDRIKIWGSFVRMEDTAGNKYGKPVEGYVYLGLGQGKEAADARAEWKKWQKAAGTGKVLAVGACHRAGSLLTVTVRKSDEKATKPDADYTPGHLTDLDAGRGRVQEPTVKDLLAFVKERQEAAKSAARSSRK
jgi:hypothetical protein